MIWLVFLILLHRQLYIELNLAIATIKSCLAPEELQGFYAPQLFFLFSFMLFLPASLEFSYFADVDTKVFDRYMYKLVNTNQVGNTHCDALKRIIVNVSSIGGMINLKTVKAI